MSFGIGGLGGATDPADFGLGLLGSASGIDDDNSSFDTPSLSLSNLSNSFDQEIQNTLTKMQGQSAGIALPQPQEIQSALTSINQKQPLNDDQVKGLTDKFSALGTHANNTIATGGVKSFIALQESLVGLQHLVENYGSKEAAAALGTLYGKLDQNNQGRKFISEAFSRWSKIDYFSFSSSTSKGDSSNESKRSSTREIQYMMFISLQVGVSDQDPLLQTLRESAYVNEACEQCGPNGHKTTARNTELLSASEQGNIPITPIQ